VFIPPAFAIEARYVKVLIDGSTVPDAIYLSFRVEVIDQLGVNVALDKVYSGSHPHAMHFEQLYIQTGVSMFGNYHNTAFLPATVPYICAELLGACWVVVDLGSVLNIKEVRFHTFLQWFTLVSVLPPGGSAYVDYSEFFCPVTDYRVVVSNDNLNWTLAAVVTNAAGTTRTDTITLEDLGGGMDIDINYVVALFLAIIILGFFRQIFF